MATQHECMPFTVEISTESAPECKVIITNSEDKDYCLLRRHTPLEGLMSDIFRVKFTESGNVKIIPYNGILLKRGPPTDEEYVPIKAKSSKEEKINLSHAYLINFPGIHTVQLKMSLKFYEDKFSGTHFVQKVDSNTAQFTITDEEQNGVVNKSRREPDGAPLYKIPTSSNPPGPKSPKLVGNYPNPRDEGETEHAYKLAYSAIEKSIPSTTENPELYKEWFGDPYTPTAKSNYTTMKSTMEKTEFTLHACPTKEENKNTPETSYHGFTYRDGSTIYLGDLYFDADLEGTDSKMGTIVHEMSHSAAGTKDVEQDGDYVYGQEECQKLAMDHPELAIINADNHEYFSEAQ